MPVGSITRGTTNTNRLRRVDRWIAEQPAFRHAADAFVVDLGHGASGVTTFELAARLRRSRPDVEVLGLEIDPARVRTAREQLARTHAGDGHFPTDLPVTFDLGGFEIGTVVQLSPNMPGLNNLWFTVGIIYCFQERLRWRVGVQFGKHMSWDELRLFG